MGDWLVLGEQFGFRRKEWAQDRTHQYRHKDYQRDIDCSSSSFTLKYFGEENKK